ncbi:MAG: hypothetical protein CSA20_09055 [Deltaproteobacteria bacterium]|nr:MAG: hypothetical protein CSA20_09055 [Deltaproteobacteria bacterium]
MPRRCPPGGGRVQKEKQKLDCPVAGDGTVIPGCCNTVKGLRAQAFRFWAFMEVVVSIQEG